jgi:fructoselysine 6-kinase
MHIVCVGEITIDRYLDLERETVGGISLNAAVNARRAGAARVGLVSCVGSDAGAGLALAKLAREGVEHSHVHRLPGPTARQDIRMLPGGERLFPPGGYHPGVLAEFALDAADLAYVRGFELALFPVFRQLDHVVRALLDDATFAGRRGADFLDGGDLGAGMGALAGYLPRLDLAFVSAEPSALDALEAMSLAADTPVIVTLGAAGSVALIGRERFFQPAIAVETPIDTTGAGDAFQAAFALVFFQGGDVRRALLAGAERAAAVIGHYGATGE